MRYETLYEQPNGKLQDNAPVLIEKVSLLKDTTNDSIFVRCIFRSLTDKVIKGLMLDVKAADAWGNEIDGVKGFQLLDLQTKREALFGQTVPIPMPDVNTRGVDVVIRKVLYEDRSMEECAETFSQIPAQVTLSDYFHSDDLVKQYARETFEMATYVPIRGDKAWRCACGATNSLKEQNCYQCNANRELLFEKFNPAQIKKNLSDYQEEIRKKEEIARQEREKRQREEEEKNRLIQEENERREREENEAKKLKRNRLIKKIAVVTTSIILLAAIVYGVGWHLIPHIRYAKAASNVELHNYDEAYQTYVELGDYKDSVQKAIETLYAKAVYLEEQEQYEEAAAEYEKIPDYEDSAQKAETCKNEANYLKAIAQYEAGEYDSAIALFQTLDDYEDSVEWILKVQYTQAADYYNQAEYEQAYQLYETLAGYEDSDELAKESLYQAAQTAYENADYETAYQYYDELPNYKNSEQKAIATKYLYADECLANGDYEQASELFGTIEDYKDSEDKYKQATYLYGKSCYDSGNYVNARIYFQKISGYEDADALYIDSNYNYALNLMAGKAYRRAVDFFEELDDYEDSKTKINEAKYCYVITYQDRDDTTTYSYLRDLKEIGYLDAAEIYDNLYAWKLTFTAVNNSKTSTKTMTSISKYDAVYFHYTLSGGTPDDSTTLTFKYILPNGEAGTYVSNDEDCSGQEGWYGWADGFYTNPWYGASGTLTVKAYDSAGNMIGSQSVKITN